MKKIFLTTGLLSILSAPAMAEVKWFIDVVGTKCEFVAIDYYDKGESYLVKCPIVPELAVLQKAVPDSTFMDGVFANISMATYAENKDVIWVNVVPNDCGGKTGYRVLVNEPVFDGNTLYSVTRCE